MVRTPPASEVYTKVLDFFRCKDTLPVHPNVHLRVLRGVGVEWEEHSFLGRESESIYLHKVDHPVHSFLEQFHAVFQPRAVCVETSEVGVRPYRQVVGVHGQHYFFLAFTAVSTSWTMMLNNRGAITDP